MKKKLFVLFLQDCLYERNLHCLKIYCLLRSPYYLLKKNNDFSVEKSDKIIIAGEIFDAQPLLKSLYKKDNKKTFGNNFKNEIKINFETRNQ